MCLLDTNFPSELRPGKRQASAIVRAWASTLSNGFTVATHNDGDFETIAAIKLFNPWKYVPALQFTAPRVRAP